MEALISGVILGLSITAPIGPVNTEAIRRGLKEGWRSSFVFCMGAWIALALYLLLVTFGLSHLTGSKLFNLTLQVFGIVVLFVLAYCAIRDFYRPPEVNLEKKDSSKRNLFSGIVLTLSNPAVLIFWTGILGADLASGKGNLEQGVQLSGGILIGCFIIYIILALLIQQGGRYINPKNFRYVSLGAGLVLGFFALKFSFQFFHFI